MFLIYKYILQSTVMNPIKWVLLRYDHFSEILFSLAHHRHNPIKALVSSQRQKNFYELLFINITSYENMQCQTFDEFFTQTRNQKQQKQTIVLMDIPTDYQILYKMIKKSSPENLQLVILLPKVLKKFINFVNKKFQGLCVVDNIPLFQFVQSQYPPAKLIDINAKIKELVETSYDINRAGFYAYGAYIRNFQENLMKRIFRVSQIYVDELARSFGFTYAPRVKGQGFIKKVNKQIKLSKPKIKLNKPKKTKKTSSKENQPKPKQKSTKKVQQGKQEKQPINKTKPINKNNIIKTQKNKKRIQS